MRLKLGVGPDVLFAFGCLISRHHAKCFSRTDLLTQYNMQSRFFFFFFFPAFAGYMIMVAREMNEVVFSSSCLQS